MGEGAGRLAGGGAGSGWSARDASVPAHSLKEPSVAITVGLLSLQDGGGFEGLAVLLLGSLDVILWRAEEESVRNQVPGDDPAGAEERGFHHLWHCPCPPLYFQHHLGWPPSGQGETAVD